MMLVQIPAIDAVSVPALPSLPSLSFNLGIVSTLAKPSTWIVLLASLVILSSIRAALLYIRPPTWTEASKRVSYVSIIVKEKETPVGASPSASSIPGGVGSQAAALGKEKTSAVNASSEASQTKKMSSWLWGLVKWDSLPPAAAIAERGGWQPPSSPQMQQIQRQTRRQRPSFEQPLPALYESQVPVSMAKMIMSRHTFRRPASRPPPVRATNVPQYQRRMPSMV
ncbi:hypothetical protein D9613_001391 [Agrocybe pediades]|uniref:Uncharacterized protein n=1 Tax=Agrocybe pediades TaxID=84607 RepID=A0A8H4R6E0_9AGAR|nr:hypothetical protein D9613_001391 [Agrocybe pediades]